MLWVRVREAGGGAGEHVGRESRPQVLHGDGKCKCLVMELEFYGGLLRSKKFFPLFRDM